MSGVRWNGTYALCSDCGSHLATISPISDKAVCYHGKYGCANDDKHYAILMALMTEVPPAQQEAQQETEQ